MPPQSKGSILKSVTFFIKYMHSTIVELCAAAWRSGFSSLYSQGPFKAKTADKRLTRVACIAIGDSDVVQRQAHVTPRAIEHTPILLCIQNTQATQACAQALQVGGSDQLCA